MQFREFGEWISRISHGTERYLVFGHQATVNEIVVLAAEAGVSDRIHCHRTTGVAKDFIYVVVEQDGINPVHEAKPLVDALHAAIRADLKGTLVAEAAEAMDRGEGFRVLLDPPTEDGDDLSATSPFGAFIPRLPSYVIDILSTRTPVWQYDQLVKEHPELESFVEAGRQIIKWMTEQYGEKEAGPEPH